eukprot:TRINITY_DN212_c2_g1_i5.p1 TRINITY_DN212_c2_g1~~TRINITY_DN212_c2_g1_i5.p1  ORF type:complete len:1026 (-),score=120.84 TRINITY_DN212_c2_g1_i5:1003-4080(-)
MRVRSLDSELFQYDGTLNIISLACMSVSVPLNIKLKLLNLLFDEISQISQAQISQLDIVLCELLGVQLSAYGTTQTQKTWGLKILQITKEKRQQFDFSTFDLEQTHQLIRQNVKWVIGWVVYTLNQQSYQFGDKGNQVIQLFKEIGVINLEDKAKITWLEVSIGSAMFMGMLGADDAGVQELGISCVKEFVKDRGELGMVCLPFVMHRLQEVMECKDNPNLSKQVHLLLSVLPYLGHDLHVHPYILKTITPFLKPPSPKVLRCLGMKLLIETWKQGGHRGWTAVLAAIKGVDISEGRELKLGRAQCILEICKEESYRALELVQEIQQCLEDDDSTVQALGLQCLVNLCEDDAIEFYSAWRVVHRLFPSPPVSAAVFRKMVDLLRFGALDAANLPDQAASVVDLLWLCACSDDAKVRKASIKSLGAYSLEILDQIGALRGSSEYQDLINTETDSTNRVQLMKMAKEVQQYEERQRRRFAQTVSPMDQYDDSDQTTAIIKPVGKHSRNLIDRMQWMTPLTLCRGGKQWQGSFSTPSAGPLLLLYSDELFAKAGDEKGLLPNGYGQTLDVILNCCVESGLWQSFFYHYPYNYMYSWEMFIQRWARQSTNQWTCIKGQLSSMLKTGGLIYRGNICVALGALSAVSGGSQQEVAKLTQTLLQVLYEAESLQQIELCIGAAMGLSRSCTQLNIENLTLLQTVLGHLKEHMKNGENLQQQSMCACSLGYIAQYLIDAADAWGDDKSQKVIQKEVQNIIKDMLKCLGDDDLRQKIVLIFTQIQKEEWSVFGELFRTELSGSKQSEEQKEICGGVLFGLAKIFVSDQLRPFAYQYWQALYACMQDDSYKNQSQFWTYFSQSIPMLVVASLDTNCIDTDELKSIVSSIWKVTQKLHGQQHAQVLTSWSSLISGASSHGVPLASLDLSVKEISKLLEKAIVQAQNTNGKYDAVAGVLLAISSFFNPTINDCKVGKKMVRGIMSTGQYPKECGRMLRVVEIAAGVSQPVQHLKVDRIPAVKDIAQWALASAVAGMQY